MRGRSRPGAEEIDQAKWLGKIKVKDRTAVNLLASEFGQGESEVLVLGKELEVDWLILDDARARTAAVSAGYRIIGLAGILLLAKHRNLIKDIKPFFDELVEKTSDSLTKLCKRFWRKQESKFTASVKISKLHAGYVAFGCCQITQFCSNGPHYTLPRPTNSGSPPYFYVLRGIHAPSDCAKK